MFILIVVDNIERHKTGLQARVIDGEIHSFKSYMCVCVYIYIYIHHSRSFKPGVYKASHVSVYYLAVCLV